MIEDAHHLPRHVVCDDWALCAAAGQEIGEVTDFIVEASGFKGLVKFHGAAIDVPDGRMDRVPPLARDCDISQGSGEQSFALAVEPETAIKLGHPVEVLGLQCGKRVDADWAYLAEGLDLFYWAEPVEREE